VQQKKRYKHSDDARLFHEHESYKRHVVDCCDSHIIYTTEKETFNYITSDMRNILYAGPLPVVIGGVITLGAFGTAIAMGIAKGSAQDKATNAADQIHQHGGTPGTCVNPAPPSIFYGPCQALNDDNNAVNNDALVGNIMVGVGAVALLGTALYWILAPKGDDGPAAGARTSSARPVLAPIVGPHTSGLSLSGTF